MKDRKKEASLQDPFQATGGQEAPLSQSSVWKLIDNEEGGIGF